MTPEQLRLVRDAFLQAQDASPQDREDFARALGLADVAVLDEVVRLIRLQSSAHSRSVAQGDAPSWSIRPREPTTRSHGLRAAGSPGEGCAGELAVGDVIRDRYELVELIGAGAFGRVFRANDRVLRRPVAVKSVLLTGERGREMYHREAAGLRRARVPGVVEVLATEDLGRWALVVMRLVEGGSFPGEGVTCGDLAAILPRAIGLFEAVSHLHAAGIYHRDLKPSNILVSAQGLVTLVDLGIAEDETDAARWLPAGDVAGTPAYMAPERRRGGRATVATELFALGVVLMEALTGELPVVSDGLPVGAPGLERYSRTARRALEGSAPQDLVDLVSSLVAEDPRDRPGGSLEALDALRAIAGPDRTPRIPWLGDDAPVRTVLGAVLDGGSIDVAGPPGSGRSRVLDEVEDRLCAEGRLVHRVRRSSLATADPGAADLDLLCGGRSVVELDRELCAALFRRVTDGLVLLVDDFDDLDLATGALVTSLRECGAVVRAVAQGTDPCVRLNDLCRDDLLPLFSGPERLLHLPSRGADALWERSRGRPAEVARAVASLVATGLARWESGRLVVTPEGVGRLGSLDGSAAPGAVPQEVDGSAAALWNALTLVGAPLPQDCLAEVLQFPDRFVRAGLTVLDRHGLVHLDPVERTARAARGSPALPSVPQDVRAEWSRRAARFVPPRSPTRYRLLVAAGRYEEACRVGLDVALVLTGGGRLTESAALLDDALALARRYVPADSSMYADLLAAMADAVLGRATRTAIDLALYHAMLAPAPDTRARAWVAILEAAAAHLNSEPARALDLVDAIDDLPTEAHRTAAHVVANIAARMTRSLDAQRERVVRSARWARRGGGDREVRARVASWTGWLRYEQAATDPRLYVNACGLHARAARLTRRARSRTTFLCNAAMAALEFGELDSAAERARQALQSARRTFDTVNEARAELLLRQVAYRRCDPAGPDEELVEAADRLDTSAIRGALLLNEGACAWRSRRIALAGSLASRAANDLRASGFVAGSVLATVLASACGARADAELLALVGEGALALEPPGLAAQAVALAAPVLGTRSISEDSMERARHWARISRNPHLRREVLSPGEVLERLDEEVGETDNAAARKETR